MNNKILDLSKKINNIVRSSNEKLKVKTPEKWMLNSKNMTPSTSYILENKKSLYMSGR